MIRLMIFVILILAFVIFFVKGRNDNKLEIVIKKSKSDLIAQVPNLDGVESCIWMIIPIGVKKSRVPGPASYKINGLIYLTSLKCDELFEKFNWNTVDKEDVVVPSELEISNNDYQFFYCKEYEEHIKSGSGYIGRVYVDIKKCVMYVALER